MREMYANLTSSGIDRADRVGRIVYGDGNRLRPLFLLEVRLAPEAACQYPVRHKRPCVRMRGCRKPYSVRPDRSLCGGARASGPKASGDHQRREAGIVLLDYLISEGLRRAVALGVPRAARNRTRVPARRSPRQFLHPCNIVS